ncbi:hypothetical protein [Clostridium chauvoei]|uniref:Uncharacterized protein n=2 Tax=Clostridium chauvoei TaxID=46867 RepID=S6FCF0_9CLOT|nr:hypothetical protein [Clostridium chauvoei]ATD53792.1 hypothetical protein BTM20_00300 [Clostridium chauvoei]ATD58400.1 hypothetical protein BTM21_12015 [Clostridium chauvoei]MBX7281747.1 hypothetical protein [Clostridium chauvoei]MBX7284280.1 hypothetical protein [Clostridium chauvoei]MBX7286775.1 hypothetical protein [Clostridium chauvoei]
MNDILKIKFLEEYNNLVDNGVIFYYGSESISYGEVTCLDIKDDLLYIELNGFETYEIDLDDFEENHSKEGVNYHSWALVREFDNIINKLIKG